MSTDTLNFTKMLRIIIPITIVAEVIINVLAMVVPSFMLMASWGNRWLLPVALVATVYSYSLAFILLAGLALHLLPKPQEGKLQSTREYLKYALYQAIGQMVRRNKLANVTREATPFPGHWFYWLAGARIHATAAISDGAVISDPFLTEIGENSVIGHNAKLLGHTMPAVNITRLGKIRIGKNVLIGASAIIFSGASIGDFAQIQAMSLVKPGTQIPPNEVWGGIPAQKIRDVGGA